MLVGIHLVKISKQYQINALLHSTFLQGLFAERMLLLLFELTVAYGEHSVSKKYSHLGRLTTITSNWQNANANGHAMTFWGKFLKGR